MRKRPLMLLLLVVLLMVACNGEPDPIEEEPTARPTPTTETAAPTEDTSDDGYPAQPQPTAPVDGYPPAGEAGQLTEGWIVLPAGTQCEENLAYPTADSAVEELENAGITPLAVEETELLVCEACGCPTSAHYRVLVSAEDMALALSLGWQPEG